MPRSSSGALDLDFAEVDVEAQLQVDGIIIVAWGDLRVTFSPLSADGKTWDTSRSAGQPHGTQFVRC